MPPTVTICISTYNRPTALRLCLISVLRQTLLPAEILIGDDGSTRETKKLIDEFIAKSSVPIVHVWHADEGFRLAAIRNRCFGIAKGDYVIQIDGDLILDSRFVEDHVRFAKPGTFLCGSRSLITEAATKELEQLEMPYEKVDRSSLLKKYNSVRQLWVAYVFYFLKRGKNQVKYVLGANMSFWRCDLLSVNGYNEDFRGWGKEDNDLALRLVMAGTGIRFLKHVAVAFHLHHKVASLSFKERNEALFEQTKNALSPFVANGIVKHLPQMRSRTLSQ
jgi:glycosyltransferase involved in cell wall biosynthesis